MPQSAQTIWIVSPYHTGSHAAWAAGYQRHSGHRIELLTMAGRFWKWRMQGGPMELTHLAQALLAERGVPDAIVTTDMVNLPSWLGLLRGHLPTSVPIFHYMHENQLTYPWRPGEKVDLTYAMINWLSQLAADQVLFNSHYHMQTWFAELPKLLKHFPDYNHLHRIAEVEKKSSVLPVGINALTIEASDEPHAATNGESPPLILWNQRWEYDKDPEAFFTCLYRLQEADIPFTLAVAGENFRNVPDEFQVAQERLADRIVHWGYLESAADYIALLRRADLVISTAIHEFFGISILEAIAAGAFPLLPARLSYPELIPTELHPACLYQDSEELFEKSRQRLQFPRPVPPSLQQHVRTSYDWSVVAARYDQIFIKTKS